MNPEGGGALISAMEEEILYLPFQQPNEGLRQVAELIANTEWQW
jgi:hypothetical protein